MAKKAKADEKDKKSAKTTSSSTTKSTTKKATTKATASKATTAAKSATKAKSTVASKTPKKATAKAKAPEIKKAAPVSKAKESNGTNGKGHTPAAYRALEEENRELPLEYNDTKVVLLVRDPEWVFAYWELSEETRKKHGLQRNSTRNRTLAIRVIENHGGANQKPYDVVVNDYTSSWYLRVPTHADSFKVELGIYSDKGDFVSLATSNTISLPKMGISHQADVEFADISDEVYEQILHLSGGVKVSERLGGDPFLTNLQSRIFDSVLGANFSSAGLTGSGALSSAGLGSWGSFSPGGSSDMFSGMFSSGSLSSSGLPSAPYAGGENIINRTSQKEDFWLEVGVDVIVYGATEPDAKVTFMGQPIELNRDGTFRFRMVFPDTEIEFPVIAESASGKQLRKVMPVVTRRTEGDPREPV